MARVQEGEQSLVLPRQDANEMEQARILQEQHDKSQADQRRQAQEERLGRMQEDGEGDEYEATEQEEEDYDDEEERVSWVLKCTL